MENFAEREYNAPPYLKRNVLQANKKKKSFCEIYIIQTISENWSKKALELCVLASSNQIRQHRQDKTA